MQPGINKNVSEYMAEGGWVDGEWVRFRQTRPEKIGGWVSETVTQDVDPTNTKFTGVVRDVLGWTDLTSKKYLATGSHLKLELFTDNLIYDITPVDVNRSILNVISTTNLSSIVTITDPSPHNRQVGDYVFVNSQGAAVDGITLSGGYVILTTPSTTDFTIDSGTVATGTTALAGGTLDIDYLLPSGSQSNGNLTGWSGGTWNREGAAAQGWNRPRAGVGGLNLRQWSLDNWGEDLLANPRGGKIYQWDATSGVTGRAVVLAGAPDENSFILVSQPSRHLIAFGSEVFATSTFDPLIIRWASQESLTDWTIATTNTAGEYRLPKGNKIVGAIQTKGEIIIFTESEVYSMRYVGGNEVFRVEPLGTNISTISQHAAIDVNGVIYWMGIDDFYMYDGTIRALDSTLSKFIFDEDSGGRLNLAQKEKTFAGINKQYHEVWWLVQRHDDPDDVGHYFIYNYIEKVWYFGTLDRTVWVDNGAFDTKYAISTDGSLYSHEVGKDADGAPQAAFIQSGYFDIGEGEELMFIDRILPDINLASNRNIEISLKIKRYPHPNADIQTKGPYFFDDSNDKISLRARGRQMAICYNVTATGADFEVGKVRLGMQPDGERA